MSMRPYDDENIEEEIEDSIPPQEELESSNDPNRPSEEPDYEEEESEFCGKRFNEKEFFKLRQSHELDELMKDFN